MMSASQTLLITPAERKVGNFQGNYRHTIKELKCIKLCYQRGILSI